MNDNREPASANTPATNQTARAGPGRLSSKIPSRLHRYWGWLAAGAALVTAGAAGLVLAVASQASAASTMQWAAMSGNIHQLSQQDPATTAHFYNTPSAFGAGASTTQSPMQSGYATTPVLDYTSYAKFASDVANRAITYPYKWVMYDPENWTSTPVSEQQDPVTYLRKFGQLAHANGFKVIMAPARDLSSVQGSLYPQQKGESSDQWYVRVGIPSTAAKYGDILLVQDEYNAPNLTEYDWLYNTAAVQARGASSGVKVFSEVSTDFGTLNQMVAAAKSISPDGMFVAAAGDIPTTEQFFQQMKAAGY